MAKCDKFVSRVPNWFRFCASKAVISHLCLEESTRVSVAVSYGELDCVFCLRRVGGHHVTLSAEADAELVSLGICAVGR